MLESVGHAVSRLIRIRYGAMVLPRGLKRGAWMELDERDIQALLKAVGADRPAKPEVRQDAAGRAPGQAAPNRAGWRALPQRRSGSAADGAGKRVGATVRQGAQAQPDPLKTSVGYIGADSLSRQRQEQRKTGKGLPVGRGAPRGRSGSTR